MTSIKKLSTAILIATVLPFSTATFATETGGGCGVGKLVMEGKSGKNAHLVVTLINTAINYAIGPVQTLAMTSGTLGCDVSQSVSNDRAKETFLASNQDNLMSEIAQGSGANLASLASLMGISTEDRGVFFETLQSNYEVISASDDVLASVNSVLQAHPRLMNYAS